jgi:hypothetical protein
VLADPKQRTEDQVNEIIVLRKALTQVEHHQAKLKEDMVYARGEVHIFSHSSKFSSI